MNYLDFNPYANSSLNQTMHRRVSMIGFMLQHRKIESLNNNQQLEKIQKYVHRHGKKLRGYKVFEDK